MTVERTRELLGEDVARLTDSEVLFFIQQRSKFCDVLIGMIEAKVLTPAKERKDNE